MIQAYLFDVDTALTSSGAHIDLSFKRTFKQWVRKNSSHLVTSKDYSQMIEALGSDLCFEVDSMFCCSGNSVYSKGKKVRGSKWSLGEQQITWLNERLAKSLFVDKKGRHIEKHEGLVRFSFVGVGADVESQRKYFDFNRRSNELGRTCALFNTLFEQNNVYAEVEGHELVITERGKNKQQVLGAFYSFSSDPAKKIFVHYFGNDEMLIESLRLSKAGAHKVHHVKGWKDTAKQLRTLEEINHVIG